MRVSAAAAALLLAASQAAAQAWHFTDVTEAAGLSYVAGYQGDGSSQPRQFAGGVAVGDFDGDGLLDLYVVRGDIGPNLLFRNRGDGTFTEVGAQAGVAYTGKCSGPVFADFDGDGWLDLFVGGVEDTAGRLFRNRGDGTFEDVTERAGLSGILWSFGATFGDYDRDGYLDLITTHWGLARSARLWHNEGNGMFSEVTGVVGITFPPCNSFTANFADIDNDGWPDLLVAGDFSTSQVFLNNRDGTFRKATNPTISDKNGMGAAVGDYDGDGNLDWFVSSIWSPNTPFTGNRLYRGRGDGTFEDATDTAGVRTGGWEWAASFEDFNNDGALDLCVVNGAPTYLQFVNDPAQLFVNDGNGHFTDRAAELGVADTGQGRGIACFDFDGDGDLDIFIANNQQPGVLYRNDGGNAGHWLRVILDGQPPNTQAIGARVFVSSGGRTQIRELRAGSNYVSQDPAEAFFGLGPASAADELRVVWPDGTLLTRSDVPADLTVRLSQFGTPGRPGAIPVIPEPPAGVAGR